ncbi:MAG: penicillin-binding protein 2 [Acidimicrobiia bacterium]|nr:penicillin-binding protein 2 [Acidimicrobiia bacterium]
MSTFPPGAGGPSFGRGDSDREEPRSRRGRFSRADSRPLRLSIMGVIAIALLTTLVVRLWYLQVVASEQFVAQAVGNVIRTVPEPAPRGRIFDVWGRELVGNRTVNVVTMDAFVLRDQIGRSQRERLALELARQLSRSGVLTKSLQLTEAMADPSYGPFDRIPLAVGVSDAIKVFLAERNEEFPGVEVVQRTQRVYPYGDLASHVLGYIDTITAEELEARPNHPKRYSTVDEIGKSGVELAFEDILRGSPGWREIEVDNVGNVVRERGYRPPQPGTDVVLTIDADLQRLLEDELLRGLRAARQRQDESVEESFTTFSAPAGAAVVLDPRTGNVLALASYPTYDPRVFIGGISEDEFAAFLHPASHAPLNNRAIQGVYSPGSTMKPITSYAALSTGLIGPSGFLGVNQTTQDPGFHVLADCVGECEFENPDRAPNGDVDLRMAITVSSDVYFYKLAEQFAHRLGYPDDQIQHTARDFGFGQTTGVALPFEHAGIVPDAEIKRARHESNPEAFPDPGWRTGDTINVSIGQGDLGVTPLQLANSFTPFANGGRLYLPNIAVATIDPISGEVVNEIAPRESSRIYAPPDVLAPILDGMRGATTLRSNERLGTAYNAFEGFPHNQWPVAGKTGTAEVLGKSDSAVFVGFGPLPQAEYVVAVLLEEAGFGGESAAPVVRRVLEAVALDRVPEAPTEIPRQDLRAVFPPETL